MLKPEVGQSVIANGKIGVRHSPHCGCISQLKSFVGMKGVIVDHSQRTGQLLVDFPKGTTFWFHEDELEVVPKDA